MTSVRPRCQTPLHHWHARHGARFAESDGWQVPAAYSDAGGEAAAHAGAALADLSALAKLSVHGRGVPAAVRALLGAELPPRGVAAFADGVPGLACRLRDDHLLLLASATGPNPFARFLASGTAVTCDATSAFAGFCLAGPRGEEVLRRLTSLDVAPAALPVGSCAETGLAGVHALLVRTAELVVPSLRVYVTWDLAEYAWEALVEAGCTPLGLDALQALARPQAA